MGALAVPDLKDFLVAAQEATALVGNLRQLFYSESAGASELSGLAASCGPEGARGHSARGGPRMAGKPNS